tara:strand:- start:199 stop:549 length:351 start_codon:yes stop_codon:yes gene_type:complete
MLLLFTICGYLSIIFALITQLPQVYTMVKHKSGKNISYIYLSLLFIDCLLYIIYGIGFLLDKNYDGIPIILVGVIPLLITSLLGTIKTYFRIRKYYKKKRNIENKTITGTNTPNII